MTKDVERRTAETNHHLVRAIRTGRASVMAMTMRANAVGVLRAAVITILRLMIGGSMGRGRLGRTGCGIDGGDDKEDGENDRHRRKQLRPCRHRPGHLALVTVDPGA